MAKVTTNVNGLSLIHKGSGGVATCTTPDVCNTPPAPAPVPYTNVAFSSTLANGTLTITADGGHSAAINGSEFASSIGDEGGSAGGVASGVNLKEATWITHSPNVKLEGQYACRLSDKMLMNHQNTVCMSGAMNPPLPGSATLDQECVSEIDAEYRPIYDELRLKINHQRREIAALEKLMEEEQTKFIDPMKDKLRSIDKTLDKEREGIDTLRAWKGVPAIANLQDSVVPFDVYKSLGAAKIHMSDHIDAERDPLAKDLEKHLSQYGVYKYELAECQKEIASLINELFEIANEHGRQIRDNCRR